MVNLNNRVLKKKSLQRIGKANCLILPKLWLEALNWTQEDVLNICYHADEKTIVISKEENSNLIIDDEETDKHLAE